MMLWFITLLAAAVVATTCAYFIGRMHGDGYGYRDGEAFGRRYGARRVAHYFMLVPHEPETLRAHLRIVCDDPDGWLDRREGQSYQKTTTS